MVLSSAHAERLLKRLDCFWHIRIYGWHFYHTTDVVLSSKHKEIQINVTCKSITEPWIKYIYITVLYQRYTVNFLPNIFFNQFSCDASLTILIHPLLAFLKSCQRDSIKDIIINFCKVRLQLNRNFFDLFWRLCHSKMTISVFFWT